MRRLFICLFILGISVGASKATHITVSGDVSGTWDVDTVFVAGEISIPAGESLIIEHGVSVIFQGYYKFSILTNSTLKANGELYDYIKFSASNSTEGWNGLRFISSFDSSRLNFCRIVKGATNLNEDGGGIFCDSATITVSNCIFDSCDADRAGGGIYLSHSNAVINNCIFNNNRAWGGCAISCMYSDLNMNNNIIMNNRPLVGGLTAVDCYASHLDVQRNIVFNNNGPIGSGLGCNSSDGIIRKNIIASNFAGIHGGGLYVSQSPHPIIEYNIFLHNGAGLQGAAISVSSSVIFSRNTIANNHAGAYGGAVFVSGYAFPLFKNCIMWDNTYIDLSLGPNGFAAVTYSDIQDTLWPGLGNISTYPAFVDTAYDDYRLLWGSPCIDSGNPDSLDPDGTRSDMGAFYFDQSVPVRVLLTPHQIPYLIPETGGSMDFTLRLDNWTDNPHAVTAWCNVTLPDSSTYGPTVGPVTVTVAAHTMLARVRTQTIPAYAPLGVYHYNAYAAVEGDTSRDNFMFGKLGPAGNSSLMAGGWSNTGEEFQVERTATVNLLPSSFCLFPPSPNPFNPTTAISYQLSANSRVSLRVYDTAGRLVATLTDGWREAGVHKVTFDESGLASGLYFVRMRAGSYAAVQKMILLK